MFRFHHRFVAVCVFLCATFAAAADAEVSYAISGVKRLPEGNWSSYDAEDVDYQTLSMGMTERLKEEELSWQQASTEIEAAVAEWVQKCMLKEYDELPKQLPEEIKDMCAQNGIKVLGIVFGFSEEDITEKEQAKARAGASMAGGMLGRAIAAKATADIASVGYTEIRCCFAAFDVNENKQAKSLCAINSGETAGKTKLIGECIEEMVNKSKKKITKL